MGILTRRPQSSLNNYSSLQNEMNQLFDSFFSDSWSGFPTLSQESQQAVNWHPRVNVSETEKEYRITAELAGLDEKDLDLTLDDNVLFLKGERRFEKESDEENFHRIETAFGSFQRTIPFAKEVDPEKVSAKIKKGVLTVKIAKTEKSLKEARKINIS